VKPFFKRRLVRILIVLALAAAVVWLARRPILVAAGRLVMTDDAIDRPDIAIMTAESGAAGQLELADLYAEHRVSRVGVLLPDSDSVDSEIERRGVHTPGLEEALLRLGIPEAAMVIIPAKEGGTTDAARALAAWLGTQDVHRLVLVTSADHGHRVRRALLRAMGRDGPVVMVHPSRWDTFKAEDWWESRATLRRGLGEIQKLLLDFALHPIG